ncbi:MAG: deoxyribodipyrimidine photo-lyase [Candidatus Dojkabacteria bacterium]|nr:deoxyribodipyrimidine photo-lyase [Candidatus Dojkabacteria bacterium]
MNIIVWHRRDLRTIDNLALFMASKNGIVYPVFIFDPFFLENNSTYCSSRIVFLIESIKDLAAQYKKLGSELIIRYGNPIEKLLEMKQELNAEVYYNNDTNSLYGFERDKLAKSLGFFSFDNDAIQRPKRQDNWKEYAKNYFESEIYTLKRIEKHNYNNAKLHDELKTLQTILQKFSHDKVTSEKGGSKSAEERLNFFINHIKNYPKAISKPYIAERYTSRLSVHFSFGTISLKYVYQKINILGYKGKDFFLSRLFWNQHFTQKLNDNPSIVNKPVNSAFESFYDQIYDYNPDIFTAWKEGKTGYILVDAAMRALKKTGFLNFRMRALVASFLTYVLKQPWKLGADYMFSQLIDADFAINYYQWQMQSGMVGIHPNRIYNPVKQIKFVDPDLDFILKYVEEARDIPLSNIFTDPEDEQYTLFTKKYIPPIVSFRERSKWARDTYNKINKIIQNQKIKS